MKPSLKLLGALIAGVMAAGLSASASAASLQYRINNGAFTTVADDGAGDALAGIGQMSVTASVGGYNIVFNIASTKPLAGSAQLPQINLTSSVTSFAGTGDVLEIQFTDTGYTGTPNTFNFNVGGSLNGTNAVVRTYADSTNAAFGHTTLLATQTGSSGGGLTPQNSSVNFTGGAPYSLTTQLIFTGTRVAGGSSIDYHMKAPLPGTVALLGLGMVGIGALRRSRKA